MNLKFVQKIDNTPIGRQANNRESKMPLFNILPGTGKSPLKNVFRESVWRWLWQKEKYQ